MDRPGIILSEEELQAVEDLAALNYSPERIALYLEQDKAEFLKLYYEPLSDIRTAYDRGQMKAEFLVNQKQLDLAKSGNITAAQIFLKEAEKIRIDNIRKQVLFSHEAPEAETNF